MDPLFEPVVGNILVPVRQHIPARQQVDLGEGLATQYAQFPVLGERRKQYAATLSGGEYSVKYLAYRHSYY